MTRHPFDVQRVRSLYPALQSDTVWLDGAAGTQSPASVIDAITEAYRTGTANGGGVFPASHRADTYAERARAAVADLVHAPSPTGVVLGPNMTTLTYRIAQLLSHTWRHGDNIVVSRLDHDANVRPWIHWAAQVGAEVRWAELDVDTGELPVAQFADRIDSHTRLVAVTAASNILGTRPDVRAIADIAHGAGSLLFVDGVHATAHGVTDMQALGADFYATSAYKWDGPHVGCVAAAPELWHTLAPLKLASAPSALPECFEWGTPSFANLAGVEAAVNHLAALCPDAKGSRRERLEHSLQAAETHELALFTRMHCALEADPRITLFGSPARRTATAYFRVAAQAPEHTARRLAEANINAWHGHNYAWEATGALGIRASGGAVRISLSHYTDDSDVDRLLQHVVDSHAAIPPQASAARSDRDAGVSERRCSSPPAGQKAAQAPS